MNRQKLSNILIYATAVVLIAGGALHLSAFGAINAQAQAASPENMHVMLPMLWIGFGIGLIATGLTVGLVALENSNGSRYVLFASAIYPGAGGVLLIVYVGFLPPAMMLLLGSAMAVACGVVREPRKRRSTTGA